LDGTYLEGIVSKWFFFNCGYLFSYANEGMYPYFLVLRSYFKVIEDKILEIKPLKN